MTPDERKHRAQRASQILNDEVVQEALKNMRASIIENWQKVPLRDVELKEKFHVLYGMCDQFEKGLQSFIEDGEVATFELKEKKRFGIF
jgi:hypothetical protein